MRARDDRLDVRPGRIRHGNRGAQRPKGFVDEVMRAAKRALDQHDILNRGRFLF